MSPEDIIRVERIVYKFRWNKKWDGKCPDRIKRQVLKNIYDKGGLKAPDITRCSVGEWQYKDSVPIIQRVLLRTVKCSM